MSIGSSTKMSKPHLASWHDANVASFSDLRRPAVMSSLNLSDQAFIASIACRISERVALSFVTSRDSGNLEALPWGRDHRESWSRA